MLHACSFCEFDIIIITVLFVYKKCITLTCNNKGLFAWQPATSNSFNPNSTFDIQSVHSLYIHLFHYQFQVTSILLLISTIITPCVCMHKLCCHYNKLPGQIIDLGILVSGHHENSSHPCTCFAKYTSIN